MSQSQFRVRRRNSSFCARYLGPIFPVLFVWPDTSIQTGGQYKTCSYLIWAPMNLVVHVLPLLPSNSQHTFQSLFVSLCPWLSPCLSLLCSASATRLPVGSMLTARSSCWDSGILEFLTSDRENRNNLYFIATLAEASPKSESDCL